MPDYAPEFYNKTSTRTNPLILCGYTGNPQSEECTAYFKRIVNLNDNEITLFGSVEKNPDPQKNGREVVMAAPDYQTIPTEEGMMRFANEEHFYPVVEGYQPISNRDPNTAAIRQTLLNFIDEGPKNLRPVDQQVHDGQTKRILKGKGPKNDSTIHIRDHRTMAKKKAAHGYLSIQPQYCAANPVDAEVRTTGATATQGPESLPSTAGFLTAGNQLSSEHQIGGIQEAQGAPAPNQAPATRRRFGF